MNFILVPTISMIGVISATSYANLKKVLLSYFKSAGFIFQNKSE